MKRLVADGLGWCSNQGGDLDPCVRKPALSKTLTEKLEGLPKLTSRNPGMACRPPIVPKSIPYWNGHTATRVHAAMHLQLVPTVSDFVFDMVRGPSWLWSAKFFLAKIFIVLESNRSALSAAKDVGSLVSESEGDPSVINLPGFSGREWGNPYSTVRCGVPRLSRDQGNLAGPNSNQPPVAGLDEDSVY